MTAIAEAKFDVTAFIIYLKPFRGWIQVNWYSICFVFKKALS